MMTSAHLEQRLRNRFWIACSMKSASSKRVAVNLYALGQRPLDVVERDLDATRQLQRIDGRLFLDSQDDGWPGVVRALASFDRGPFRTVPRLRTRPARRRVLSRSSPRCSTRSANRPSRARGTPVPRSPGRRRWRYDSRGSTHPARRAP